VLHLGYPACYTVLKTVREATRLLKTVREATRLLKTVLGYSPHQRLFWATRLIKDCSWAPRLFKDCSWAPRFFKDCSVVHPCSKTARWCIPAQRLLLALYPPLKTAPGPLPTVKDCSGRGRFLLKDCSGGGRSLLKDCSLGSVPVLLSLLHKTAEKV